MAATPPRRRRATKTAPPENVELANLNLPPLPDGYGGVPLMSATEERRERELEDILNEVGSDARVKVFQIIDGKASYAGDLSAEGFTLDVLLDNYGGGEKSLTIMQGKTKVETVRVSLDPSIPAKNPRAAKVATAPGGMPDMSSVLATMAASQMQSAQAMVSMMGGIVGAMTTAMTATRPTSDPMDTALKMAEIMTAKGRDGGNGGIAEAMTLFREGMELGERFGGKEEGDPVMGVVSKGLDTLAALVNGIVEERKAAALAKANTPTTRMLPPTDGNGAPPVDPDQLSILHHEEPVNVPARPWARVVAPHISKLLQAASFMPPDAAAATISSMLTEEEFSDLIDDISDTDGGGFGVRLAEYFPAVKSIDPQWIGNVLTSLLNSVEDEEGAGGAA